MMLNFPHYFESDHPCNCCRVAKQRNDTNQANMFLFSYIL